MSIKTSLIHKIEEYVREHPGNRSEDGGCYFGAPLVGTASLTDPLFDEYKKIIGPFHWTPTEVLGLAGGCGRKTSGTVVCWVLPITEKTCRSNRKQDKYPSREWVHTRDLGEQFNDELRRLVADLLIAHGGRAVAPMLHEKWSRIDGPGTGLASSWSERHAMYAAGLGTFSLSDGFITSRGIAHRCGSVVTDIVMEPSDRPYGDHRANCLTCRGEECGVCVARCPVGAISMDGHDKDLCRRYIYGPDFEALARKYGTKAAGCGLCQTDVPCEDQIPDAADPGG